MYPWQRVLGISKVLLSLQRLSMYTTPVLWIKGKTENTMYFLTIQITNNKIFAKSVLWVEEEVYSLVWEVSVYSLEREASHCLCPHLWICFSLLLIGLYYWQSWDSSQLAVQFQFSCKSMFLLKNFIFLSFIAKKINGGSNLFIEFIHLMSFCQT